MWEMTKLKIHGVWTSSQDGGVGRHASSPYATTRRITTNLKTKNHPELPENRNVWKPDNQGFKEIIFI